MFDNRAAFVNFKEIPKGTWPVAIANEQNMWVLSRGDIIITRRAHDQWLDGTLHDVLYIDIRINPFPIERAANRGVITISRKNICQMIGDNRNGDKILTGIRTRSSLYKLQMKAIVMDKDASCTYQVSTRASESNKHEETTGSSKHGEKHFTKRPKINNIELWHHRFCHINSHTLRQTVKAIHGMLIQDKKN